jgi:hypothetical protein
MENKSNLFISFYCSLWFQELVFLLVKKKNKDSYDNLRKSHQKTYPLDSRSGIRKKFIPDPWGKKATDPESDPQH